MTEELPRVQPQEVRERLRAGAPTLLVCAYSDESKCKDRMLDGAIVLGQLERIPQLGKNVELVFY